MNQKINQAISLTKLKMMKAKNWMRNFLIVLLLTAALTFSKCGIGIPASYTLALTPLSSFYALTIIAIIYYAFLSRKSA